MEELATIGRPLPAFQEAPRPVEDAGSPDAAVVIIDRELRVLFANQAAHRLLGAGDGLSIRHGVLCAELPGEMQTLRSLAEVVFDPDAGCSAGARARLGRLSASRAYACHAQRLSGAAGSNAALLFLSDPDDEGGVDAASLKQRHELTPAEAELAALLASGVALKAAAKHRGISYETARTQLKSLFQKTGCRKQGQLVALLLSGRR
jgi:DNA-binding CsgD family transcriptional regulator